MGLQFLADALARFVLLTLRSIWTTDVDMDVQDEADRDVENDDESDDSAA